MRPAVFTWLVAAGAAVLAAGFALTMRLPLPFDGFAALVAAVGAGTLTLSLTLLAPAGRIWTDAERLSHAFAQRHKMSTQRSALVLDAITAGHGRADQLRRNAALFAPPLEQRTREIADRLDEVARDLFYHPDALSVHREALVRSALIEEAVLGHAKLRGRGKTDVNAPQVAQSRARVDAALTALEQAFDQNESRLADRLVQQVELSSATAEMLLKRRKP